MAGIRIGEAAHPGPLSFFEELEMTEIVPENVHFYEGKVPIYIGMRAFTGGKLVIGGKTAKNGSTDGSTDGASICRAICRAPGGSNCARFRARESHISRNGVKNGSTDGSTDGASICRATCRAPGGSNCARFQKCKTCSPVATAWRPVFAKRNPPPPSQLHPPPSHSRPDIALAVLDKFKPPVCFSRKQFEIK